MDLKPNSLTIKAPHLRSEWSSENTVNFDDVSYGSQTKYKWVCVNGHKWEASPNRRTDKGRRGCSRCPRNSLAEKASQMACEWHSDNPKRFHEVSFGSVVKYKWICVKCQHIWVASPNSRTHLKRPTGCPECFKRVTDANSLATKAPHLKLEWHSSNSKQFHEVHCGSNDLYMWICRLGHTWTTTPNHRTKVGRKSGCPDCAHRRVSELNSLATKAPWLEKEWHFSNKKKFHEVAYASPTKYTWICAKGHTWDAQCGSRTRKNSTGCPECHCSTSRAEQAIFCVVKEKYQDAVNKTRGLLRSKTLELDIYIPSLKKAIEYDGTYWHSFPGAIERDVRKNQQCIEVGIQLLRVSDQEYEADREGTVAKVLAWLEGNL